MHYQPFFFENKESYSLKISDTSTEELNSGLWLVLAGVNDIPPHIALINEGSYYSVSAKKVEVGVNASTFLKAISRRSLPTLFVGIRSLHLEGLREAFEKYPTLGNGSHSCLWPVRDFFEEAFSPDYKKVNLVFELLALAQKQQIIKECKSMFVEEKGIITLPKYTGEQIREKINSLLKVNE
jgi:hypothetical protein